MDGLIVLQPFASLIINGEKKWEFRSYKTPADKISRPIYLISEKKVLGEIAIRSCRYNQVKHNYFWSIQVLMKYVKPKSYNYKNGAQIWVKDVEID
jgi:predicted transcriptional regulator